MPNCLHCSQEPTIRAHLIPQAFAREVRDGAKSFALTKGKTTKFQPIQNGLYDDTILCAACDQKLGSHEKYALEVFKTARELSATKLGRSVGISPVDGDKLIRFASGVAWKFCETKKHYGRIELGPYADTLRSVALSDAPIPQPIDMFMIRLKAKRFEEHFYRSPMPDRQGGLNFVRLTLGAILMFLKIDQRRRTPTRSIEKYWMKGRTEVVFPVERMEAFEEGRFVRDAWRSDQQLAQFLLKNSGANN